MPYNAKTFIKTIEDKPKVIRKNFETFNSNLIRTFAKRFKSIRNDPNQNSEYIKKNDYTEIFDEISNVKKLNLKDIDLMYEEIYDENIMLNQYLFGKNNVSKTVATNSFYESYILQTQSKTNNIIDNAGFKYGDKIFSLSAAYLFFNHNAQKYSREDNKNFNNLISPFIDSLTNLKFVDRENMRIQYMPSIAYSQTLDDLHDFSNDINENFASHNNANGIYIYPLEDSAFDHLEYQGKTYTKEEYDELNDVELDRPIGTGDMNCRHVAMEINLENFNVPYSKKEIEDIKKDRLTKISYENYRGDEKKTTKIEAETYYNTISDRITNLQDSKIAYKILEDYEKINKIEEKVERYTSIKNDLMSKIFEV